LNAVEVEDIEKHYGRVRALAGITTALPSACLHLVSGANGAGKSTLLRVVAGLTRPTRGRVRVLGHDLFRSQDARERARVGYLGPDPSLYPELTVAENLAFQARLLGVPAQRVARQIAAFDLQPVADRRARVLSTGFRRRSGLARALIGDPDVLVLDEPWNGLDSEASDVLARALDRVRGRGATGLVAAHTVGAYAGLFDHTIRIEDGRLEPPGAA